MQSFLADVQRTGKDLQQQREVVQEIDAVTRKVSGAATEDEMKKIRDKIGGLREDFIIGMREIKDRVQKLKEDAEKAETEHNKHIKKQHVHSLVERVKNLIEHFSTAQSEFGDEEKNRLKSQYIIARPSATNEEIESAIEGDEKPVISLGGNPEKTSVERKESLKNIFKGIQEVSQMTEQLNLLVTESDKNIDKVSEDATKSEKQAKKADVDLKKAHKYQKFARFAKLFVYSMIGLLLLLFIFGVLGICVISLLYMILSYSNFGSSSSTTGNENNGNTGGNAPTTNIFAPGQSTQILPAALIGSNPQI